MSTQMKLQEELKERNNQLNRITENWMRTEFTQGNNVPATGKTYKSMLQEIAARNPHHARCIASAAQQEYNHMKKNKMNETTISTALSTHPENVIKVIMLGMANSIRPLAFVEWPLTTVDDAMYWVDRTYEQSIRGATANDLIYYSLNGRYAGESKEETDTTATSCLPNAPNGGTSNFTITLTLNPIISKKTYITLNDTLIGYDSLGTGVITRPGASTVLTTNTTNNNINYTTGVVKLGFTAAPAGGAVIKIAYEWDSENTTLFAANQGTVSVNLRKDRFNARPMPLGYKFTDMAGLTLMSTGLGDIHEMLVSAVADEHAKARDARAIQLAYQIARTNGTYTFDCDFRVAGEVQAKSHVQKVVAKIDSIGGLIQDDIKKGQVNVAIAGSQALAILRMHDNFKEDNSMPRQGCYKAGSVNGIDVFYAPATTGIIGSEDIILSYKNPQENADVALAFGNFTEISAELRYPNFTTEGSLATVEDVKIIEPKFLRFLQLSNTSAVLS